MKKAKIFLTAIGILAVVGGALAFKANRGVQIFCEKGPAIAGACTTPFFDFTIAPFASVTLKGYCTITATRPCTALVGVTTLF